MNDKNAIVAPKHVQVQTYLLYTMHAETVIKVLCDIFT